MTELGNFPLRMSDGFFNAVRPSTPCILTPASLLLLVSGAVLPVFSLVFQGHLKSKDVSKDSENSMPWVSVSHSEKTQDRAERHVGCAHTALCTVGCWACILVHLSQSRTEAMLASQRHRSLRILKVTKKILVG